MNTPDRLARNSPLRRIAVVALWSISILFIVIAVNVFGIVMIGGTQQWDRWLIDHRLHFFVWRAFLYVGLAFGWYWMRARVVDRETSNQTSMRLRRAEVSAALAIALVETISFLPGATVRVMP